MNRFHAFNVTVLVLDGLPDAMEEVFPPECHVTLPIDPAPVDFDFSGKPIGTAVFRRVKNRIVADFEVTSKSVSASFALQALRGLTPAVMGWVLDRIDERVMAFKIGGLSLITGSNANKKIKVLGDAVRCTTPGLREVSIETRLK